VPPSRIIVTGSRLANAWRLDEWEEGRRLMHSSEWNKEMGSLDAADWLQPRAKNKLPIADLSFYLKKCRLLSFCTYLWPLDPSSSTGPSTGLIHLSGWFSKRSIKYKTAGPFHWVEVITQFISAKKKTMIAICPVIYRGEHNFFLKYNTFLLCRVAMDISTGLS